MNRRRNQYLSAVPGGPTIEPASADGGAPGGVKLDGDGLPNVTRGVSDRVDADVPCAAQIQ
jgi:hypothetical protein